MSVPDGTASRWIYHPFEGFSDGKVLCASEACRCKNNKIEIFEAVEVLLVKASKLRRRMINACGLRKRQAMPSAKLNYVDIYPES